MKVFSNIVACVANLKLTGFRMPFLLFLSLSITVFFGACSNEEGAPADMFYEYFPDTPGHFVVYNVDSVVYDDFTGQTLTYNYQVKELIESRFLDGEGKESIRLERFIRQNPQEPWEIKNIWQARVLAGRAEKTEENITYIKMVFPPRLGQNWDGNAYNTMPSQTYRITEAHKPYLITPTLSFDSTVTVLQNDFFTLISEDLQEEKYARHIGLVFKRYRKVNKQVDGTITSGVDYSYRIVEFGEE
jgi:hypothetical protein